MNPRYYFLPFFFLSKVQGEVLMLARGGVGGCWIVQYRVFSNSLRFAKPFVLPSLTLPLPSSGLGLGSNSQPTAGHRRCGEGSKITRPGYLPRCQCPLFSHNSSESHLKSMRIQRLQRTRLNTTSAYGRTLALMATLGRGSTLHAVPVCKMEMEIAKL